MDAQARRTYAKQWRETNADRIKAYSKTWREANREKTRENARAYLAKNPDYPRNHHLRSEYGLTQEQYDEMFEAQQGRCAICGEEEPTLTPTGERQRLAIDHDHSTGDVRALLCRDCNFGIGRLKDNPEILDKAAAYLRDHKEKRRTVLEENTQTP